MGNIWENLLVEMGLLVLLGVLYYFYQRRKILHYESNKGPLVMGYMLQSFLSERGDTSHPRMDSIIEAIDDYLQNKVSTPPTALLRAYAESAECSPELREIIFAGLQELADGKE